MGGSEVALAGNRKRWDETEAIDDALLQRTGKLGRRWKSLVPSTPSYSASTGWNPIGTRAEPAPGDFRVSYLYGILGIMLR